MDPAEAIDLLLEDGESPSDDAALVNDAVGKVGAGAIEARRCGRARPGAVLNLKHNRGPVPDHVRALFGELCRQPRIDSLLESIDRFIEPLERSLVPDLEATRRAVAHCAGSR